MPSHEEHCQDSLRRYGKRFDELHRWMDEPSTLLGSDHRIHRHDPVKTPLMAKELFGELADQACLDHMRLDELEERRSKKEKSEKPNRRKEGYWKNRKYRRISVDEVVRKYWGDEFLEELTEKCNETPYKVNQDYLRKRDKALIAALFLTGGRVNEVLMLRKKNFDFDNEEATKEDAFLVRDMIVLKQYTKGKPKRVRRTFPIWNNEPLVQYLREWVDQTEDYLFPSQRGKKPYMDNVRAYQIVRDLGKRLHPKHHINPHMFRKQRELYLVKEKGYSPSDIQLYLKMKKPLTILRHRKDWQNLLYAARSPKEEKMGDFLSEKEKSKIAGHAMTYLEKLESALRWCILTKLSKVSKNWWMERIPYDVRVNAQDRKKKKESPWPWFKAQELPVVYYLDFSDYIKIIQKKVNWPIFNPVFKDQDIVVAKLKELKPIRDDLAHARKITTEMLERLKMYSADLITCVEKAPK